ncbi:unnamed protein product, partial [Ixodes persulcatus]
VHGPHVTYAAHLCCDLQRYQEGGAGNTGAHTILDPQGGSLRCPETRSAPTGTRGSLRRRPFLQLHRVCHSRPRIFPVRGLQRRVARQTWRSARSGWFGWPREIHHRRP